MPHPLIDLSPDLKKLWDDGLQLEIKDGYLLVKHIPYVNNLKEVKYGTLVSILTLAGNRTTQPGDHVVSFIGEHPCMPDGSIISAIQHQSENKNLGNGLVVNHSFSNKPGGGYPDYYMKMSNYISIISGQAKILDPGVTAKTHQVNVLEEKESVYKYFDTNSSKAEIGCINEKLKDLKIAIVGVGGTGSYILDLVAKTPVKEIHLYDGDDFLQNNAFRAPGAPSVEKLQEHLKKADYFKEIYSNMRRGIISHDVYINETNVHELTEMNFVFMSLDTGAVKKLIVESLEKSEIPFIDVGIGLRIHNDQVLGLVSVIASTNEMRDAKKRITFADDDNNEYSKNIQIADLNALNATLAVIKWKKLFGFYQDFQNEYSNLYSINTSNFVNNDIKA